MFFAVFSKYNFIQNLKIKIGYKLEHCECDFLKNKTVYQLLFTIKQYCFIKISSRLIIKLSYFVYIRLNRKFTNNKLYSNRFFINI